SSVGAREHAAHSQQLFIGLRMAAFRPYLGPFLIFDMVIMTLKFETAQSSTRAISSDNGIIPPWSEASIHPHRGHRKPVFSTVFYSQHDGPSLEGLKDKRRVSRLKKKNIVLEHFNISPDPLDPRPNKNSPGSPTEPVFPPVPVDLFLLPITTARSNGPYPSSEPQARGYSSGDIAPTFNIALFDWTHYEEMIPAEKKQQFKQRGSCCNLRKHVCEIHNRGFNNKCYDSCMCEEGLRCYARSHRHYRITRKKGQCVDPEGLDHDMFIFV
ncbi:hypothetical protein DNTS_009150, partial [Danionella cerebrum]